MRDRQMTYNELKQCIISDYKITLQCCGDPDNRIDAEERGNWDGRVAELWGIIVSAGWSEDVDRFYWPSYCKQE